MSNGKPLFCIGNNDYTTFITVPSYKVNFAPVAIEWEDCNYVKHKIIKRRKAAGSFSLLFNDQEQFKSFLIDVNNNTAADGSINLKVYINDRLENYYGKFYLTMDLQNDMPFMGVKEHDPIGVTIEEC